MAATGPPLHQSCWQHMPRQVSLMHAETDSWGIFQRGCGGSWLPHTSDAGAQCLQSSTWVLVNILQQDAGCYELQLLLRGGGCCLHLPWLLPAGSRLLHLHGGNWELREHKGVQVPLALDDVPMRVKSQAVQWVS